MEADGTPLCRHHCNECPQEPKLQILVQPQQKFRFRYKSEMTGKHGNLLGQSAATDVSSKLAPGTKIMCRHELNDLNMPPSSSLAKCQIESTNIGSITTAQRATKLHNLQGPPQNAPGPHSSLRSNTTANAKGTPGLDLQQRQTTRASAQKVTVNNSCVTYNCTSLTASPMGVTAAEMNPSPNGTKLYPTVKLHNFSGEAIIRCRLVTENEPYCQHPHRIQLSPGTAANYCSGTTNANGLTSGNEGLPHVDILVNADNDHTAIFQGLNIIYVGKRDLQKQTMKPPEEKQVDQNLPLYTNLNTVRLHFEAFLIGENGLNSISKPVMSSPVHHNKSAQTGDLRIVRIDKHASYCTGDEEVFILVEKVDKHNIQVKFFEEADNGKEIWKAYGKFSKLDVHHQYAIVFKTPPYRNCQIDTEVDVWLQLERPSDSWSSAAIPFKYKPVERLRKMPKRQKPQVASGGSPSSARRRPGNGSSEDPGGGDGGNSGMKRDIDASSVYGSQAPSADYSRQGAQKFPCDLTTFAEKTQVHCKGKESSVAFNVALSVGEGLHSWAETSDFDFLLHRVRHLLCLVDANGDNSLHAAILNKQREPFMRILRIITCSPDVASALNEQNVNSQTPLSLAVTMDCPEFVEELVRHNVDASIPNMDGDNPIHLCAKTNNVPCLRALMNCNNARKVVNRFNYQSMTPLHMAVSNGHLEAVEVICGAGACLTSQEGTFGRTALHLAVEKGSITATVLLLRAAGECVAGNITNIQNYRGDTPLHVASSSGLVAICAILCYYGADPHIENFVEKESADSEYDSEVRVGQTASALAANEEVLKILMGNEESWEKLVKNCYHLLDAKYSDKNAKVISLDSLNIDSGIDIKDLSPYSK